jgi:sulfate adenylyltransferase
MRLASGLAWTLPVTLAATADEVITLREGGDVVLRDPQGEPLAILHLEEIYAYDREEEAEGVFRTSDPAHPGVATLLTQGEWLLGGPVTVLRLPRGRPFVSYRLTPREVRVAIADRGWRSVVGFQTRNPIHRAHEYLCKVAQEIVDGLMIHPLVGETKPGDIPAAVRMECYKALIEKYFAKDRTLLSVMPAAMRYAGPKEAILHAIVRKNYGCTHFIVGRDHAGVGNYYGSYDAQQIFDTLEPDPGNGGLGMTIFKFEHTAWSKLAGGMVSPKTFPKIEGDQINLSGTQVRDMLARGERPPVEFSRPEVADVLIKWARGG